MISLGILVCHNLSRKESVWEGPCGASPAARVGHAKNAGECTDYGDYNILMLEHLAATAAPPRRVSLDEFVPRWMEALPKWRACNCIQVPQTYLKYTLWRR